MISVAWLVPVGIITYLLWRSQKTYNNGIPGYHGVPILGVVPYISIANPAETLREWSKTLGTVYWMKLGFKRWIVLNDNASIKNVILVKNWKSTWGRCGYELFVHQLEGGGIGFKDDIREIKKVLQTMFRTLMPRFKVCIKNEANYLAMAIKKRDGQTIDIKQYASKASANIVGGVVANKRREYEDAWFDELTLHLRNIFHHPTNSVYITLLLLFYNLRHFPVFKQVTEDTGRTYKKLFACTPEFHRPALKERKQKLHSKLDNDPECIIDDLILLSKNNTLSESLSEIEMIRIISDLYLSGTDTSGTSMDWAILHLAHDQNLQDELYKEITNLEFDEERETERQDTPYTSSFIDEVARYRTIVPFGIYHRVTEGFKSDGFTYNKDDAVIVNLWAANRDPNIFEDPDKFQFDRFVNPSTKAYEKSKNLLIYGAGSRMCLGYKIAEIEIHALLCALIINCRFVEDPKHPLPSLDEGRFGAIFGPLPYKIKIIAR